MAKEVPGVRHSARQQSMADRGRRNRPWWWGAVALCLAPWFGAPSTALAADGAARAGGRLHQVIRVHLPDGPSGPQAVVHRSTFIADFGSREGVRVGSVFDAWTGADLVAVLRVKQVWRDSAALALVTLVDKPDRAALQPLPVGTGLRPKLVSLESIQFAEGQPDLSLGMRDRLYDITRFVRAYPDAPLLVEGYTDDAGNVAENRRLSAARANAVLTLLHEVYRVPTSQMRALGRGEADPVASNASEAGRQLNRRVELTLVSTLPDTQGVTAGAPDRKGQSAGGRQHR